MLLCRYRIPLSKAKAQFAIHQRVAAHLESLQLLTPKPEHKETRAQPSESDDETKEPDDVPTEDVSRKSRKDDEGNNDAAAKFKHGQLVLYECEKRWVAVGF